MVDENSVQFTAPITKDRRDKFGLWCKINDMTQEQGLALIIDNHVPGYNVEEK